MKEDPGGWETRLDGKMIDAFSASGAWRGVTIAQRLDRSCNSDPNRPLFIDGVVTLTRGEVRRRARALAASLTRMGLRAGEVVSFQLPNWHEAAIIDLACAYGGFVCNPIVTIYRDREVGFIVRHAGSRVLFVPERFRDFDHLAMAERCRALWPEMCEIVCVRPSQDAAHRNFTQLLEGEDGWQAGQPDPNHVKLLMYTSGTTGPAKGVLHTHNTIDAEIANVADYYGLHAGDRVFMPSPLGHITGYLYGVQLPITLGASALFMEQWNAAAALDLIDSVGLTFTVGATPFLQELTSAARHRGTNLSSLRCFATGGAPVPPEVILSAAAALPNCSLCRVYGSTESPTITLGVPDRSRLALAAGTEGFSYGSEFRLIDTEGRQVAAGEEGEIITRGPELCIGYAEVAQNAESFDADGFFHTGDLGRKTPEGCLVITGRRKDLIIRGGENISAKEVEDVLHQHPDIVTAAVVAMPHARLGETGCAFLILRPRATFDLVQMTAALDAAGLARQKFPERIEIVDALPMTPAGKIQKNVLREIIAAAVAREVTEHSSAN